MGSAITQVHFLDASARLALTPVLAQDPVEILWGPPLVYATGMDFETAPFTSSRLPHRASASLVCSLGPLGFWSTVRVTGGLPYSCQRYFTRLRPPRIISLSLPCYQQVYPLVDNQLFFLSLCISASFSLRFPDSARPLCACFEYLPVTHLTSAATQPFHIPRIIHLTCTHRPFYYI